ncbi:MAG: hypothetical protein J0J06_10530 [Sphingomonas sp.]|uniref:hypothetical protein n=1 Tax=Sphingomonas sp. TaxID=28214 RepID=UPI001AC1D8BA|nr:hypothetical protein [Sphingomonas sp.]MBN8815871.1 hypothetical protein [Sphingomonas sp.]
MMRWLGVLLLLMLAVPTGATPAAEPDRYAEGQVWEYRTRPQDAGSLIKIQRIEDGGKIGRIYHVSIIGLSFAGASPGKSLLVHCPVSRQTLDASVTKRSDVQRDWPDMTAGIAEWRAANGGVFTIGIAEIVTILETTMSRGAPKSGGTT